MKDMSGAGDAEWYFGGLASAGACFFTHPIDLIRVQMQSRVPYISASEVCKLILKHGGISGFYHGIFASVQRQLSYSIIRFGIYESGKHHGLVDTFWQKVQVAGASGLLTGYINTPLEKVNVHVRTDIAKSANVRRNYGNAVDGIYRIYMKGGVRNLYSAGIASAGRGMFLNIGQLSMYDHVKEKLIESDTVFDDNWETFFIASLIAGGVATIITTPIDVVKTIRMDAHVGVYQNSRDVVRAVMETQGFLGLFKGLLPSFCRIVPQTVLTFMIYEELRIRFGTH